MFKRLYRFFFGYDVFISYARKDGSVYAIELANQLGEEGLTAYVDQFGSEPGGTTPKSLYRIIEHSSTLVVLGTPVAGQSDPIQQEVALFVPKKRPIIPVDWSLERGCLVHRHSGHRSHARSSRGTGWWAPIRGSP